jgi:hypothetical protein
LSERRTVAAGYRDVVAGTGRCRRSIADLFNCVVQRAGEENGVALVGLPVWLHGDTWAGACSPRCSRICAGTRRRVDRPGAVPATLTLYRFRLGRVPVPSARRWMGEALNPSSGGLTLRNVLDRHGSGLEPACWPRRAALRLPVAAAARPAVE